MICEICSHWAGEISLEFKSATGDILVPTHHKKCPFYNDSLMDVWKLTLDGKSFYVDTQQLADEYAKSEADEENIVTVTKMQMHREIYENLPEFDGF